MTSRMIAPTIAVSHELMSKNSSSGSASNSTCARNPPRIAPTMPMIAVTIKPPGSSPGRTAFAIAPAIRPRTMKAMIPILVPLRLTSSGIPGLTTRETRSSGLALPRVELTSPFSGASDLLDNRVLRLPLDDSLLLRQHMIRLDEELRGDATHCLVLRQGHLQPFCTLDPGALADELGPVGGDLKSLVDFLEPLVHSTEHRLVLGSAVGAVVSGFIRARRLHSSPPSVASNALA